MSIVEIDIPKINANISGSKPGIKNVGKIITEDNCPPKYTAKIAATATEDTNTPIKIPIEQVIAIEDILIIRESNIEFK